jgi:hypothetical protein
MAEEWGSHEVIVQCRKCLARIDVTKLHKGRLILGFKDKGHPEIELRESY